MKIVRRSLTAVCALALLSSAAAAKPAQKPAPAAAGSGSGIADLKVDIAYSKFVLKNGLTLIVHEDHKAPIVAVNVWYHVGSKNEPHGRTGFAHLFEHLMFTGSEHHPGKFNEVTEGVGATEQNGTTNGDRTNYFENVPTSALDTVLWLEADRMGFLLGSIDQGRLDEQRGVVQNEKRQGDNQPYAISQDLIVRSTYASDHPYGHTTIGSMDDLNAAKLDDVKEWFRSYYGASNAVITLAGDITPAEAKAKVEKFFGDIPPGPPVAHPKLWIAKRTGEQRESAFDRVPQPRLYKVWNTPQFGAADADYLDLLSDVLVGDKTSRLYKRLVYQDQTAVNVSAFNNADEIGGQFYLVVTGKAGADMGRMEAVVNEEMAKVLAEGPTAAEIEKFRTRQIGNFVRGLERTGGFGGKSDQLATSEVFLGSPDAWKASFARLKTATATEVRDAGRRWLSDGAYVLTILPFPAYAAQAAAVDHAKMPAPGATITPHFPRIEHATLSNGLKVVLAQRHETPVVQFQLLVGGGSAADPASLAGRAQLASGMLAEGTTSRDALQISSDLSAMGASVFAGSAPETTSVYLFSLKPTLDRSLDLYADVIQHPAFNSSDLERVRKLRLAALAREKTTPVSMALRVMPMELYGADSGYGRPPGGTEASLAAIGRADLAQFHDSWFHPNNATLVVVGDTTLAEIMPKLEKALGAWKAAPVPAAAAVPSPAHAGARVYLIDKPGAVQTVISAGSLAPARGGPDDVAIETMNTTLGGAFISRLNLNLREDKHWSYGAQSFIRDIKGPRMFLALAPVQTDKTKESLVEMRKELTDVARGRPVTAAELNQSQSYMSLRLPGRWETVGAVANAVSDQVVYGLSDDYWDTYAGRIRAVSLADAARAAGEVVNPDALTWVIVGDRAKIEQQVRELNLGEVHVIDADGKPVT